MATQNRYGGAVEPAVTPLSKEQRQRLEAITFARMLVGSTSNPNAQPVSDWLRIAQYISRGYV